MPFLLFLGAIFSVIFGIAQKAAEEQERRDAQNYYRRREQAEYERRQLEQERYEQILASRQQQIPAPPPAPTPVNDANRRSRRFTLRIPLADSQIAMALRPIRAEAMAEHHQISGVTFASEPGGGAVELIITLDRGTSLDEIALGAIFRKADDALKRGYRSA